MCPNCQQLPYFLALAGHSSPKARTLNFTSQSESSEEQVIFGLPASRQEGVSLPGQLEVFYPNFVIHKQQQFQEQRNQISCQQTSNTISGPGFCRSILKLNSQMSYVFCVEFPRFAAFHGPPQTGVARGIVDGGAASVRQAGATVLPLVLHRAATFL